MSTSPGLCPSCGVQVKASPTQLFAGCLGCGKRLARKGGSEPWGVRRDAPLSRDQLLDAGAAVPDQQVTPAPAPAQSAAAAPAKKESPESKEKRIQRFELIHDMEGHAVALKRIAAVFVFLGVLSAVGFMVTDAELFPFAISSLLSGATLWGLFRALGLLLRYTAVRLRP